MPVKEERWKIWLNCLFFYIANNIIGLVSLKNPKKNIQLHSLFKKLTLVSSALPRNVRLHFPDDLQMRYFK
jgi:hypothetical protein